MAGLLGMAGLLAGAAAPARSPAAPERLAGPALPASSEAATFLPAGIADAAGSVACLRTPEGGVESVDLVTGRGLWRSPPPSRALLIDGERAFVLEERPGRRLAIAAYAARSGKAAASWTVALDLPAWASLAEPGDGRSWSRFEVYALGSPGFLEVEYQARQFRASGIAPQQTAGEATGVLRLDLASGRVEHRLGARLPRPDLMVPAPPGARFQRVHARPADATVALGGPPPDVEGVLVAGDLRLGFARTADGRAVSVARWSAASGELQPPLVIPAEADAIWATLDRRHVALRRVRDQRLVDVHSLATGERLATLERPVDIAVLGGRILWTAYAGNDELRLVAIEPGPGLARWTRTVWRAPPTSGQLVP
ncbi:MAG TPA: hypothetical protein VFR85_15725 [Anaeromyxobacteraceae bacterium]|nr:hypothetical protein [Anaeromyxobacteraceae bacterium]